MSIGLIGRKCGMTRIFTADGESIPVSVIEIQPNRVVQMKNVDKDGYRAVQVTIGQKKASHLDKALIGHYAKAQVEAGLGLWEFRLSEKEGADLAVGGVVKVDVFKSGDMVAVQGVTKGKGFAGVIKRYHFASQDASHGNSLSHRAPGSIGQRQTPGRVFKGKKMAGHLGDVNRTIKNLEVIKIDVERNLLLVKGGIPGAPGGYVVVKSA
jgi:large subunit ribosomal protein L3